MPISYQAQSPVLGLVLPSNSPGVHTLWLPIIPMQIGLVLKPGPQEPWTPYRMAAAFFAGRHSARGDRDLSRAGATSARRCSTAAARSLIFGGTADRRAVQGQPARAGARPGLLKILLGDDVVDHWEKYLDVMVDSVFDQQRPRLHQLLGHLGQPPHAGDRRRARRASGRGAAAAAGATRGAPGGVHRARAWPTASRRRSTPTCRQPGVTDVTAKYRDGGRASSRRASADYLLPTVVHCESPDAADREEGVHVPVRHGRRVPGGADARGDRADAGLHGDHRQRRAPAQLLDAVHIDRLNLGPVPTMQLNWLQPHEGNIVDFLFRARAFQTAPAGADPDAT